MATQPAEGATLAIKVSSTGTILANMIRVAAQH